MLEKEKNIKIGIQKKGHLAEGSLNLLRSCDLYFDDPKDSLIFPVVNFPLEVVRLRDDDIGKFVAEGYIDLGIIGKDVITESGLNIVIFDTQLDFGKCRLTAGVPLDSPAKSFEDLRNLRLATTFPNITNKFFKERNIPVEIVTCSGSVEVVPALGAADAITDIIVRGTTMAQNGLRPFEESIFESEAVLIGRPKKTYNQGRQRIIDQLISRINRIDPVPFQQNEELRNIWYGSY